MVVAAWSALVLIRASPFADYFGHALLGERSISPPVGVAVFASSWLVMLLAMMLPGVLPRLAVGSPRGSRTVWVVGVLTPWMALGFAFAAADLAVHLLLDPRLPLTVWRLPGWVWLAAGAHHLLAPTDTYRGAVVRTGSVTREPRAALVAGWHEGRVHLRRGWLLMLAVASSPVGELLVVMALATAVMCAPAYARLPRWVNAVVGALMLSFGAWLLLH